MRRAGALLVAAWCALAIAACAMRSAAVQPTQPPSPPPSQAAGAAPMPPDSHAQITQLEAQIDAQRGQLGLPAAAPSCLPSCQVIPMERAPSSSTCQPGPSDTCHDTCTLSDSICVDAKKICDLAGSLPGDTWAAGKCASAKQTCDDAHARCCACH